MEHLLGLPGSRYFLNRVGELPLVIDELEGRLVGFPRFFARQDGDPVAVVSDYQILREASV